MPSKFQRISDFQRKKKIRSWFPEFLFLFSRRSLDLEGDNIAFVEWNCDENNSFLRFYLFRGASEQLNVRRCRKDGRNQKRTLVVPYHYIVGKFSRKCSLPKSGIECWFQRTLLYWSELVAFLRIISMYVYGVYVLLCSWFEKDPKEEKAGDVKMLKVERMSEHRPSDRLLGILTAEDNEGRRTKGDDVVKHYAILLSIQGFLVAFVKGQAPSFTSRLIFSGYSCSEDSAWSS